tara:strand:- start:772 stop:948 length:177 start_codon:yes stop_codon:yes gene_type:complete
MICDTCGCKIQEFKEYWNDDENGLNYCDEKCFLTMRDVAKDYREVKNENKKRTNSQII